MAYTSGDTILDTHYNDFATSVNALWGEGTGDAGYGNATTVASVSDGVTVQATQWSTLLSRISSMANHQSSSITAITSPSGGDSIAAFTALAGNITTITNNRLNVHERQIPVSNNIDNTTNLTGTLTQTGRFTWASTTDLRHFFNLGGRLSVTWNLSGDSNTNKSNDWESLGHNCGTFNVTRSTSGKSGGSGSATTNGIGGSTSNGWENMTSSFVVCFKQFAASYAAYTSNFIQLEALTSGATVDFRSTWVDNAAEQTGFNKSIYNVRDTVDGTKRTTFRYEKHDTTYIADNAGTITFSTVTNSHA
jgi:hypothetical protein